MNLKEKNLEKLTLSLTYGLRENEIFREFEIFSKNGILPNSRNEVIRRGIHTVRNLITIDEHLFLSILSEKLQSLLDEFSVKDLYLVRDLASVILSIKIAQNGVLQSYLFETIKNPLDKFVLAYENKKTIKQDDILVIQEEIRKIAISLDNVFLSEFLSDWNSKNTIYEKLDKKVLHT